MFRFLMSNDGRSWIGLRLQKPQIIFKYFPVFEDIITITTKRKTVTKEKLINIAWETGAKSQSGFCKNMGNRELTYEFYHRELWRLNQKQIFRKIWKSLKSENLIVNE